MMQFDNTQALDAADALPVRPVAPRSDRSAWGGVMRGIAAGAAEFGADISSLRARPDSPERQAARRGPLTIPGIDEMRRDAAAKDEALTNEARTFARDMRPDPATASTAENLVFGFSRAVSKAVGAVMTVGPVAGAAAFGGSEAAAAYDDMARAGVDPVTGGKVAAVAGVAGAASILLPMVGPTLKATAGLYLAGGPGAFMAQQVATRAILERANYADLGKQYDPFDPLGLTLSALIPLPFAVHGAVRNVRAGRAEVAAAPVAPAVEREVVDAAMAHNLTVQADQRAAIEPVAVAQELAQMDVAAGPTAGRTGYVVTERGLTAPVQYRVVEAGSLVTSHGNDLAPNPAFPAELQPRDRTRAASADQIARIENAVRPELLGESVKASDGAPVVGADTVVESGNARTIALRRAYESGKAEGYRGWLAQNAEQFGLNPEQVAAMRQPVLVRERQGVIDRAEFARQANESAVAALSPTEQARADAARITDLSGLAANEDGSISLARSAAFVRQFMRDAVSPTERGAMLQADGRLSQTGQQRLRNAIFAKAYGDSDLVAMLSESTDSNVRNILGGLMRAAPEVARLRDLVDAGARQPVDVASAMVQAVREFSRLRAEGVSVDQFLAQGNLLGGGPSPELQNLLIGLRENARSSRRVGEMLGQLVRAVNDLGDPRQQSLLGDANPSTADMTATVVERLRTLTDEQITDTTPDAAGPGTDPLMRSISDRVQAVETSSPDLVVRTDENGQPVTVADELARVRKEAAEGTDAELGALDADLVRVAAECSLSMGTA